MMNYLQLEAMATSGVKKAIQRKFPKKKYPVPVKTTCSVTNGVVDTDECESCE